MATCSLKARAGGARRAQMGTAQVDPILLSTRELHLQAGPSGLTSCPRQGHPALPSGRRPHPGLAPPLQPPGPPSHLVLLDSSLQDALQPLLVAAWGGWRCPFPHSLLLWTCGPGGTLVHLREVGVMRADSAGLFQGQCPCCAPTLVGSPGRCPHHGPRPLPAASSPLRSRGR